MIYNRTENQGDFILSDIHNPVIISYEPQGKGTPSDIYTSFYEKLENIDGPLTLKGNTYLQTPVEHKILFSPQFTDFEATLNYPFFFMDQYRSYFVMPVDVSYFINQKNGVKNPDQTRYLPIQLIKDQTSVYQLPKIPVNPSNLVEKSASFKGTLVSADKMVPNPSSAISANAYPKTIPGSFMGTAVGIAPNQLIISHFQHDKGLIFNTFYHPYATDFLQHLNEGEIDSLMECDTLLPDDNGSLFNSYYNPNFTNGLIQKPADFSNYTYYKENVAFDEYSAYGLYNWELFYHAPLYIATRLSKNGKYAEAMNWFRYIFDPSTSEKPDPNNTESRYWKVLPFKSTLAYSLENYFESLKPGADDPKIDEWRDKPFDPFLVARGRPIAFMKNVVMKYIDNLVNWGDDLFRQDTIESINQATQLYIIAAHILGQKPQVVPSRGKVKAETYDSLKPKLDAFSNAIVQLENLFPFSSEISSSNNSYPGSMLGIGSALYFCIPNNDNLLQYWDTVADRLFKIRHCMNIQGVERTLALFEPPIDPGLLIKAAANGLSIGSILADLNSPAPYYRFNYLTQKASEFCSEVKALGSSLLSALEKKDNEELARLRASQEANLLNMITAVKERQVLLATADSESLKKNRETVAARANYYLDLLGITDYTIPEAPSPLQPDLGSDSPLPSDTSIGDVPVSVDVSLVDTNTSGVRIIPKEKEDLDKSEASKLFLTGANGLETLAGTFHLLPGMSINLEPFGVGGSISFGGDNIGASYSVMAKALQTIGSYMSAEAAQAGKMATFIRREQEWQQQARQALWKLFR